MKALALAIFMASVACDTGPGTLHRHRDPGSLVIAEAADVISLDPVRVTDSESIQLGEVLFEGLVGWRQARPTSSHSSRRAGTSRPTA